MRLHHVWHDDIAYSPNRRVGEGAASPDPDATKVEDVELPKHSVPPE